MIHNLLHELSPEYDSGINPSVVTALYKHLTNQDRPLTRNESATWIVGSNTAPPSGSKKWQWEALADTPQDWQMSHGNRPRPEKNTTMSFEHAKCAHRSKLPSRWTLAVFAAPTQALTHQLDVCDIIILHALWSPEKHDQLWELDGPEQRRRAIRHAAVAELLFLSATPSTTHYVLPRDKDAMNKLVSFLGS